MGDPERPLKWVSKSPAKLADALRARGHEVSPNTASKRLEERLSYSRQVNRKTHEGASHPDRNAQFEHINAKVAAAITAGQAVIQSPTDSNRKASQGVGFLVLGGFPLEEAVWKGLSDGLGQEVAKRMIVAELPYDPTDPTVDSQIVSLKTLGADVFFNEATPKFAAQAIRKAAEIGWKPVTFVASISNSVGSVFRPAGFENSKGVLSAAFLKDPTDPTWKDDPAIKEWLAFMDKYFPDGDKSSTFNGYGYLAAQTLAQVLKQCGDDLTRENVMKRRPTLRIWSSDFFCQASRSTTRARPITSPSSRCRCHGW